MDKIDKQILNILQSDGRITTKAIAERVGLSTPAALERVRKLENGGVIKGYKAILDNNSIGKKIMAILAITNTSRTAESIENVKSALLNLREVKSYYFTTGRFDFIAVVAVDDIKSLEELIVKKLSTIPYIGNVETFIVLSAEEDLGVHIPVE